MRPKGLCTRRGGSWELTSVGSAVAFIHLSLVEFGQLRSLNIASAPISWVISPRG